MSPADLWTHLIQSISSGTNSARPDPLLLEALAGLLRLHPATQMPPSANPPAIQTSYNGPYLLTGAANVVDHLGCSLDDGRPKALCRCGRSESKPYCDGSHVAAEFSGAKDFHRVPDHRDTYLGQAAVVFDNRGLCFPSRRRAVRRAERRTPRRHHPRSSQVPVGCSQFRSRRKGSP